MRFPTMWYVRPAKAKFREMKPSRNGKITLSFIYIGKSCLSREFFTSLVCLLMLFAKIKFSRKYPNLQYPMGLGVFIFGIHIHLHQNLEYASSDGYDKSAHVCH